MHRRLSPLRACLLALLSLCTAAAALVFVPAGPAGAARPARAAVVEPGASTAHPYSDPVWWPLRTETVMDCYSGNPGCRNPIYHSTWLMDVVSTDRSTTRAHEPVYAMGAGILHYGVHQDTGCGGSIPHSRGDWIWIDHGNGTLSWYGHLAWPFLVPDGAYVTPQTQIALIGNSGYSNCLKFPTMHYIDIAVKRGASNGNFDGSYSQFFHLIACVDGQRQIWPDALNANWHKWNDVPNSPRGNEHYLPATDADRGCIPSVPPTPDRTATTALRRTGTNRLLASWTRPATGQAASSIVVLIEEYHPSIRKWLELRKHVVPAYRTSTLFTRLHHEHTFRVMVSYANTAGISAPGPWASAVAH